jgi:hypothetical protein
MTDPDRARLVRRLATGPGSIARAARAAAAAEGIRPLPPGEWDARQVVGHLVATEREVFQARLEQLAAGATPHWSWVEPGVPDDPDVATLEVALATLADARAATLARLTGLDDAGWERSGVHATLGVLDVTRLLQVAADHDDDHRHGLLVRASGQETL